ncbi:E3 ubiquitin-protein ligase UPL5-like isoform X1 [Salvia splendens]|uniref:E3 ubiquitin-protein ligase UPL5-like isoform X1 n=2 Tax=Salvia splendens TaxID=180675 RepID=UPI001C266DAF|nr:E3 ubiquitin-protein ligase UPL5-like isoform X1 [Salvia splendens]
MSSSPFKRKLDDYADDDSPPFSINPSKMRKDHSTLPSPSPLFRSSSRPLQFFVRILSDRTLVLRADPSDTVESIHGKIQAITGIPEFEQSIIYSGRQLQFDQTLAECKVQNDASLYLVGRMRSTGHPKAWKLINNVIKLIFKLCGSKSPVYVTQTVKVMLAEFMSLISQTDVEKATEHLQIFSASSAPKALVMLYMSKDNRGAADEAIRHFVTSSKGILHVMHNMRGEFVPIILEFCRLLKKAAGVDDPLYCLCRSSLAGMVPNTELGEKAKTGIPDIFPFVQELSAKLTNDFALSTQSMPFPGPSLSDIRDFASFVAPFIKEIEGFCDPIKFPSDFRRACRYGEEARMLYKIFHDLLRTFEMRLKIVEDCMNNDVKQDYGILCVGSCHHLEFAKELHKISKIYSGCDCLFWETMKRYKGAFCNLVVRCAKRSEDHTWIMECKEVTNFEVRRHLAMMKLPEVKDDYGEIHEMLIDRSHLLAESFEYMKNAEIESLRAGLFMEFKNEEATGPGVLREWFFLVCQAIFNPQNALFVACSNDLRRFYPNPASKVDPMHLEYFRFSGKVIALALMHKIQVGIVFDRLFFLQLGGRTITLEDIRYADPLLYNSCKQILEMDPELIDQDALGLTFVHEVEELGTRKTVDLCTGGENIAVNSENRKKYVDSLIRHRFVLAIADQVKHFAKGFEDIIGCPRLQKSFFKYLEPEDLDWMLHGSESAICVDDWKAHTEYHGFKETDDQISWFWKIVGDMTAEQKKILLFFWTSIKFLPVEGFRGLASRLYIYKTSESRRRLPSSHTCFYRLCFPAYRTCNVMHDRLNIITQEHVGCSFGTW